MEDKKLDTCRLLTELLDKEDVAYTRACLDIKEMQKFCLGLGDISAEDKKRLDNFIYIIWLDTQNLKYEIDQLKEMRKAEND